MRIKVKDLIPNPFRDTNICPIDTDKVKRLEMSIKELTFWDNLLARPSKLEEGKYELAYGYHRLCALQNLQWEEVDIPVKPISDEQMIKIMGAENREWYGKNTAVVIETVKVAKDFIEKHIAEKNAVYEDLDYWCGSLFFSKELFDRDMWGLGQNNHTPVGRSIIEKFLGDSWDANTIKFALKVLEGETQVNATEYGVNAEEGESLPEKVSVPISKEAVEKFSVTGQGRAFVETITRDPNCRSAYPTEEAQEEIAEKIIHDIEEEGGKVTSSKIITHLKQEASKVIEESEEISDDLTDEQREYRDIYKESKPKDAVLYVGRLLEKVMEIPNYQKQRVLTKGMAQAMVNDLYEAERFLQEYRIGVQEDLQMEPDEQCIYYDCYPTATDFGVPTFGDILDACKPKGEILDEDAILNEFIENGLGNNYR